jgi:hypothetical protein
MHVSGRSPPRRPSRRREASRTGGEVPARQADRLHRHVVIGEGEIVDGHVHRPERELGVGERTGLAHASVCRSDLRVHSGELRVRRRRDPDRLSEPGAPVAGGLRRNRNGVQDQSSEEQGKSHTSSFRETANECGRTPAGREAGGSDPVDGEEGERRGPPAGRRSRKRAGSGVGKGCGNRRRPPEQNGGDEHRIGKARSLSEGCGRRALLLGESAAGNRAAIRLDRGRFQLPQRTARKPERHPGGR